MNEQDQIKKPTTFEEQVRILRSRNLLIEDEEEAIQILSRINYYRLSAYMLSFKANDWFKNGTSINDIFNLYIFDKKFRNLVLGLLETIEITFRTEIAYFIAHNYGPLSYREKENFINEDIHEELLSQLDNEIRRSNEIFVTHHQDNYNGIFPVWVAFEVTSFGLLSRIYSNLNNEIKKEFTNSYYKLPHKYIKSWLYSLSTFRNTCAHYGRIYDKSLVIKPSLSNKDIKKGINNSLPFSVLFIICKLIKDKFEWNSFVINLKALIDQYDIVDIKLMGFPDNWEELLEI